ncbi:TPA: peptide deformylase [Candidatus Sumerlaeota bacterium]|jgi:peptide deformylase|nr:peptide deformylase [Candidatus Sumerlaeota bacterium]
MPVLPVKIYGDPCLKAKSTSVETITPEILTLLRDMGETLYERHGIGLAASQVGVNLRIFVMDTDWTDRDEGDETGPRNLRFFINPEITWESEEDGPYSEGCLSVPGIEADVYRPLSVRLRWMDEKGKMREEQLEELDARCAQHEFDHLNGILFVDRLPFAKRTLLAGKLRKLKGLA